MTKFDELFVFVVILMYEVNCSSIQSLSECSNEPSCDVVGKDPWGQSCLEYVNDPRGVPPFCSCKRIGGK